MCGSLCARDLIDDLPHELLALDDPIRGGLGVGTSGKVGVLELRLITADGTTRVEHQYQRSPMYVYRPIYLDPGRADMAFVFLQQSGDGYVQGDRCRLDIACAPHTAAHFTTQAPTKVFAARHNVASQVVNLDAAADAVVEYMPDPMVPCRSSRFFQRMKVTADERATVIFSETLLPGRVAHGERHDYEFFWSETEVRRPDGRLTFADLLRLMPEDDAHPTSAGLCGDHDVVSSFYVVTSQVDANEIVARMRAALLRHPDILAGASELPNDCGAVCRLLGPNSKKVQAALTDTWSEVRVALIGAPAPDLRKG